MKRTGGTDHQSFDAVGLPGFQFIQDELDYDTRTHHANMDVVERVPKADLMEIAAIWAAFAWNAGAARADASAPAAPARASGRGEAAEPKPAEPARPAAPPKSSAGLTGAARGAAPYSAIWLGS